ncbi:MAG: S9 family peptidase, partial [Mucinivorans sp.]
MKKLILIVFALLGTMIVAEAQRKPITESNYELPARFTPDKMRSMVFSTNVDPHFLKNSQKFWYVWQTSAGRNWWLVDPMKATKTKLFDPVKLAAQLTPVVGDPFDALHLPIANIRF